MKIFHLKRFALCAAIGLIPALLVVCGTVSGQENTEKPNTEKPKPRLNPGRRAPAIAPDQEKKELSEAERARLSPMHPGPVVPPKKELSEAERARLSPMHPGPVVPPDQRRRKINPMHPGPVKPGQEGMTGDVSPEAVEAAAGHDGRPGHPGANMMHNFKRSFPGAEGQWKNGFTRDWIAEEKERHEIKPIADNKPIVTMTDSQREGHTYGNYTEADVALWEAETQRLVVEGSRIFHSADLLGSTNGTSCDMCHPDGEGTHAETYPKYQVQLGRAALLRDMANWCLENPCRAEPMSGDDARMRALEAYMQAQRIGKPMKYGKH